MIRLKGRFFGQSQGSPQNPKGFFLSIERLIESIPLAIFKGAPTAECGVTVFKGGRARTKNSVLTSFYFHTRKYVPVPLLTWGDRFLSHSRCPLYTATCHFSTLIMGKSCLWTPGLYLFGPLARQGPMPPVLGLCRSIIIYQEADGTMERNGESR